MTLKPSSQLSHPQARALSLRLAFRSPRFNRLKDLLTSTKGVAAVEFAAILPVMLLMYLGMSEVSLGVSIDRKLTILSRSVADLTSQAQKVNTTEINNIFNAAQSVLAPYTATGTSMRVTSIVIGSDLKPKVCWSRATGSLSAFAQNAEVTSVPTDLRIAGTSLIMGEARLPYQPMIGYVITGTIDLNETTYMRPRLGTQVLWDNDPACPMA